MKHRDKGVLQYFLRRITIAVDRTENHLPDKRRVKIIQAAESLRVATTCLFDERSSNSFIILLFDY